MKIEMLSKVGLSFFVSILMLSGLVVAQGIQDIINKAKDIGVFQFYLPFLIVFTILYGLLIKIKLFGVENKGISIAVALIAAGFIMVYTPVGITFSQFLAKFVGNAIVVILTFVVILILASVITSGEFLKLPEAIKGGWGSWAILLLLILVVAGVFIASGGSSIFPGIKLSAKPIFEALGGLSSTTLALIVLVVGTGLIVWLVSREKPTAGGGVGGRG